MHSAASIANAFLEKARKEEKQLTNMQVQKLVFFAHGVYLAVYDKPLIKENVRAWTFGPVIPELYKQLKKYGNGEVTANLQLEDGEPALDNGAKAAIDVVWRTHKDQTGAQLSRLSHMKDSPWDIIWNQRGHRFDDIPDSIIKHYYSSRVVVNKKPASE